MINLTAETKAALEAALKDLDYPAPRNKLIEVARINNAPPSAIAALLTLPETADFQNAGRLRETLGLNVPGVRPGREWE